ncbi:MAG: MepB family protein [Candidatus Babeliaceae bacterium]|jgi:hypothetical protein
MIHPDLLAVQKLAYIPSGLMCTDIVQEAESQEYGACEFTMNNKRIKFRVSKITPTKIGQFVTLWKRSSAGPIAPYDMADAIDFFVVSVRTAEHFGQFVFPKYVLHEHGFVSQYGKGGKRAMRVYPPWDVTDSAQAQKTQSWQVRYFFEIDQNGSIDTAKIQKLFL